MTTTNHNNDNRRQRQRPTTTTTTNHNDDNQSRCRRPTTTLTTDHSCGPRQPTTMVAQHGAVAAVARAAAGVAWRGVGSRSGMVRYGQQERCGMGWRRHSATQAAAAGAVQCGASRAAIGTTGRTRNYVVTSGSKFQVTRARIKDQDG